MRRLISIVALCSLVVFCFATHANTVVVAVSDKPDDSGGAILVKWTYSGNRVPKQFNVYRISQEGTRTLVGTLPGTGHTFEDTGKNRELLLDGVPYRYQVQAEFQSGERVSSGLSDRVAASASWFHFSRRWHLAVLVLFAGLFFYYTWRGRKGDLLYIRPIDALDAMDDAVGRAAEMGKPVLYAPGLGSLTDPVTVASLSLLSKVAAKGARLYTKTKVPNYGPLTWPVAQEVVRQAYSRAGRPDDYDPDDVPYFTSRSFTYAAATAGMMVREKTATNFFIGHFYSESLILAETGASTGALQIGGTDSEVQLPFFITTCDQTMIGEELFAAAALVSNDPVSRSSVKANDWFKVVILVVLAGALLCALLLDTGVADYIGEDFVRALTSFRNGNWE